MTHHPPMFALRRPPPSKSGRAKALPPHAARRPLAERRAPDCTPHSLATSSSPAAPTARHHLRRRRCPGSGRLSRMVRGLLLPLLIVGLCGGWGPALQQAAAQWSYSGPAAGCTDVLDAFTGGIRGNATSGSTGGFTVGSAPRFALRGPDCYVRGAFAILFDVTAMRAAALAGTYPNVSIAVGGGVHFEGMLDVNSVSNTSYLRVPTLEVLFVRNASDPFDPDALPVDVAVGSPNEASGVTWAVRDMDMLYSSNSWDFLTLRNGQHIPRGSRIAVVNVAASMERLSKGSSTGVFFSVALVSAPTPLVLVGASQLVVHNTSIHMANVHGMYLSTSGLWSQYVTLRDASQVTLANSAITAVNISAINFYIAMLSARLTLYDTAQLTVSDAAVEINIYSSGSLSALVVLCGSSTLYNASNVLVTGSAIRATNVSSDLGLRLVLVSPHGHNPVTLHHQARLNVTGSAVRAVHCGVANIVASLLRFIYSGPLVLNNNSQAALTGSTASAVGCRVGYGSVTVGGLVEAYNYNPDAMSVSGDARIVIDGVTASAEDVANSASRDAWLQVVVFGEVDGGGGDTLDLNDRGAVLITRSTATVTRSTLGALNTNGRPLAMVFSYPTTVFRDRSTVRVCGATAAVTDATIAGTFFPGPYTATPGAAQTTFGNTTIVGACDASSKASADRCGLSTMAAAQCSETPAATTATTTSSPSTTTTTASGNSSNRNAGSGGAAPAGPSESVPATGLIVAGVVVAVGVVVGVAAGCWIAHRRKQRAITLSQNDSGGDVSLSALRVPSSEPFPEHQL